MSKVFTGFDDWADPSGPGLCPACAWAYTSPAFRAKAHLVGQGPSVDELDAAGVYAVLSAGPLDPTTALLVPLRPGRKHLLPRARWGRVTLDDVDVAWGADDATRLRSVAGLRALGFGSRMLSEPAPPWSVLRRHPRESWAEISTEWAALQRWRPDTFWLRLAVHLTIASKESR